MDTIVRKSETAITFSEADFVVDGLIHCHACGKKKQRWFEIPNRAPMKVGCLCECGERERREERERIKKQEYMDGVARLKSVGISTQNLKGATFDKDDGTNPAMRTLKRYADDFDNMRKSNSGLLLYGDVGTGKSFGAACVANQLMDGMVSVLMTNFSTILNGISDASDKNEYIRSITSYQLLIIDDFGIERNTEYALEQVYNVIDARYRTAKPLIVTTNIDLNSLENPTSVGYARIYSRVLEMCIPVNFGKKGRRKGLAQMKLEAIKERMKNRKETNQ